MREKIAPCSEFQDEYDRATAGLVAYESAVLEHIYEMCELSRCNSFSPERALETADLMQEAVFEAIEAGAFDELTGLNKLQGDIMTSKDIASYFGYVDLAAELAAREQQISARVAYLEETVLPSLSLEAE